MADLRRAPRLRILLWTKKARQIVGERIGALLPENQQDQVPQIISVLDELTKNAIKANHKYLLVRRRMRDLFNAQGLDAAQADRKVEEVCDDAAGYNEFLDQHTDLVEGVGKNLRDILNQEAMWINLRNAAPGGPDAAAKEKEAMGKTRDYRKLFRDVREKKVYVELRASAKYPHVWIELINTAPIMNHDLDRIREKRLDFKKHRDAGTEHEFFMNSMDTSDGGSGLGYATIDMTLSSMGLEPLESLYILSLHSTNVMMNLDLSRMGH